MLRKITLGLIAAASLGAAALAPGSASAHGIHGYGGHGWHHGLGFGGLYVNTRVTISSSGFRRATACACARSTSALTTFTDRLI